MDEEYFTIEEVVERLKVTRASIYKWMNAGLLPYVIVGQHRRITATALRAFIRPGRSDGAASEQKEQRKALRAAA
ncbi:MAG: helix-turn-helix domain-containing protein [Chloroflexales bacterium]